MYIELNINLASLVAQTVKNLLAMRRPLLDSWVQKISWRREWQPTPVFLPGEFHGQRHLVGYSPWGRQESDMDMTEWLKHKTPQMEERFLCKILKSHNNYN